MSPTSGEKTDKPKPPEPSPQPPVESDTKTLVIPFADEIPPVSFRLHIDISLTSDAATAVRRLAAALDKQQTRLANGKRITESTQAVKRLLEQLAIPLESDTH